MEETIEQKEIKKVIGTVRTFAYTKDGDVTLSFTLNVDTKDQAIKFMEFLVEAQKDLQEFIDA